MQKSRLGRCLRQQEKTKYGVTIAAATLEEEMELEILNKGISIIVSSRLPYVGKEELSIFKSYDHIIVNTFPMLPSAYILSSYSNVVWWIHEPSDCEMYSFCKEVDKYIDQSENIEYLGILNRTQLRQEFRVIDVVVCASYEETLSLTIVEGMMNSKICITTDNTGIAEYIEDGVNGFICKAGNADSLAEKMKYIIDHFNELDEVRKNARKTYEKFFTLDILGENLERELKLAEMDRR